jgi:hypothetical protein
MLSPYSMKKQHKRPLVLARQTIRALQDAEFVQVVAGVGGSVGANAHPYTCGCPVLGDKQ